MYGLVNRGLEELIRKQHGDDAWARICARAGVPEVPFVAMQPYDDAVTYNLVVAAAEETGQPIAALLEVYGEHWIRYTAREGYAHLFELFGGSLGQFLANLDRMHARVGMSFPELRPPVFVARELGNGLYELEYHSTREALAPMVLGLLRGLGQLFGVATEIEQIGARADLGHDVFRIQT
jgi:hypothetical protein